MELIGRDQNTRRSPQNFTYPHFWWSFQIRSPNPKSTHKRLHRNPIFVRYPFCSRNGCYIYNVPTKGFVLYLLIFIYLCSSVSLIIRFLESISRVWAFLNLLCYTCFYAQSIMQQAGGGRDSFTSEFPSSIYNSPTYQWQQTVINWS